MQHFKNKQQYLEFKQAWAEAVQSPKSKKFIDKYKTRRGGWVSGEHHMLYNILTNKPVTSGFCNISSPRKLANVPCTNTGTHEASTRLKWLINRSREMCDVGKSYAEEHVIAFLAPFNGTITVADLASINITTIPLIKTPSEIKRLADKIKQLTMNWPM